MLLNIEREQQINDTLESVIKELQQTYHFLYSEHDDVSKVRSLLGGDQSLVIKFGDPELCLIMGRGYPPTDALSCGFALLRIGQLKEGHLINADLSFYFGYGSAIKTSNPDGYIFENKPGPEFERVIQKFAQSMGTQPTYAILNEKHTVAVVRQNISFKTLEDAKRVIQDYVVMYELRGRNL